MHISSTMQMGLESEPMCKPVHMICVPDNINANIPIHTFIWEYAVYSTVCTQMCILSHSLNENIDTYIDNHSLPQPKRSAIMCVCRTTTIKVIVCLDDGRGEL